jgi:hypothetical protein
MGLIVNAVSTLILFNFANQAIFSLQECQEFDQPDYFVQWIKPELAPFKPHYTSRAWRLPGNSVLQTTRNQLYRLLTPCPALGMGLVRQWSLRKHAVKGRRC